MSAGLGQVIVGVVEVGDGVTVIATVAGALVVVVAGPNNSWPWEEPIGGVGPSSCTVNWNESGPA